MYVFYVCGWIPNSFTSLLCFSPVFFTKYLKDSDAKNNRELSIQVGFNTKSLKLLSELYC